MRRGTVMLLCCVVVVVAEVPPRAVVFAVVRAPVPPVADLEDPDPDAPPLELELGFEPLVAPLPPLPPLLLPEDFVADVSPPEPPSDPCSSSALEAVFPPFAFDALEFLVAPLDDLAEVLVDLLPPFAAEVLLSSESELTLGDPDAAVCAGVPSEFEQAINPTETTNVRFVRADNRMKSSCSVDREGFFEDV